MATEVAALVARLEADTRDFQKGLKGAEKRLQKLEGEGRKTRKGLQGTDKATKGLTKSVKQFAVAAGVAFGAREVFNFFKSSISAASDLGESINAVEVTFGDAAEGIKNLGVEAARSVGLSNAEFNSLAVGFASFVEKIDAGGDNVVGVMEELTGRAADFASVMNIDVAEAATIFRSGLAGETEPLRKFGIDLSAAAVNAEALALGLAESSSELTEQDKILARFELLMRQTNKTAGDFANTSDDLANKQRIFTAELENAKVELGEALIPAMEGLLDVGIKLLPVIGGLATIVSVFAGSLDVATQATKSFTKEHGRAPSTIRETVRALQDEANARFGLSDTIFSGRAANEKFVESLKQVIREGDLTTEQLSSMEEAVGELAAEGQLLIGVEDELNRMIEQQVRVLELVDAQLTPVELKYGAVAAAVTEAGEAIDGLDPTLADNAEAFDEAAGAAARYGFELDKLPKNLTGRFGFTPAPGGQSGFFHSGGTIPGPLGANVPIIAQAGETVRTVQQERELQTVGRPMNGTVVNLTVNGFVGSELQLAAQIDKLLTRRSNTSKLGF